MILTRRLTWMALALMCLVWTPQAMAADPAEDLASFNPLLTVGQVHVFIWVERA